MPHSGFPAAVGRFTEEGLGGHIVATSVEESIPKRHYACKYPPLRPLTADEQKLVLDNLGLARQGAWRMAVANAAMRREIKGFRRYAEQFYDDFYDAAVIGLCVAAQRWDPSQGFTFGTYAFPTIRGAVQQATEWPPFTQDHVTSAARVEGGQFLSVTLASPQRAASGPTGRCRTSMSGITKKRSTMGLSRRS